MNIPSQRDYVTNTDLFATLCGTHQLVDVAITLIKEDRNLEAESILRRANTVSSFLGNYYQQFLKPTTMKELIAKGELSTYEFYAPTKPDLKGVKLTASDDFGQDYKEDQLAEIMGDSTLVGDIVRNWLENGNDGPTICFCVNVAHANFITVEFNKAGVNAEVIIAETPPEERQIIIHRFEQGVTKILVSVGTLIAGFDSDVRCIIYARPTKSEIRWVQCLGRGLRTAPGKETCMIFDHSGSVHRLGYPDDIEYDALSSKSDGMKDSSRSIDSDKAEKLPKECPSCHFMKPVGVYVCPKCGFKPLSGEDVEVDRSRGLKELNGKDRVYSKAERQSWWFQIKYYQRQRANQGKPISDGWCAHTFKSKFSEWRDGLNDHPVESTPEVNNFIKWKLISWIKSQEEKQLSSATQGDN
ncbi:DEAD/DEAH box helicase [Photorhabdus akhurstii]|uniref:DEAD/DEAH box helicase n=1 Tax=Photorhabdus akhurstii TaxID=171438 RepID=UPI000D46C2DC|nr:helicase [Photorhabdus luminescens]